MKRTRRILCILPWLVMALLAVAPQLQAQEPGTTDDSDRFRKEELVQMLAPIALYPDSLIAQILMASTYPLELVEAERWRRDNQQLTGSALDDALQEKSWDPSVKSLCRFPDVLFALSDKLDQTRKLGDAFLEQEDDVMATIQELRHKAEAQGNLKSTQEQRVVVEEEIVRIEPANPEVVYVPVYNPLYVYGPWWYPAYPPFYWYYPPGFVISTGFISFGPGFYWGFGFSWSWCNWHSHRVHVDYTRTHRFHRHHYPSRYERGEWRHDPRHRRGVAYRDLKTSERFGGRTPRTLPPSPTTRGYPGGRFERKPPQAGGGTRQDVTPAPGTRGSPGGRFERKPPQPGVDSRQDSVPRRGGGYERPPRRDTTFQGVGEGSFERKAGERGGASRGSGEFRPPARQMQPPERQMPSPGREMKPPERGGTTRPGGPGMGPSGGGRQQGGGQQGGGSRGGGPSGHGGGSGKQR